MIGQHNKELVFEGLLGISHTRSWLSGYEDGVVLAQGPQHGPTIPYVDELIQAGLGDS